MTEYYTVEIYDEEYGPPFYFDKKIFISVKGRRSGQDNARRFISEKEARSFAVTWILKKNLIFKVYKHSPNRVEDLSTSLESTC